MPPEAPCRSFRLGYLKKKENSMTGQSPVMEKASATTPRTLVVRPALPMLPHRRTDPRPCTALVQGLGSSCVLPTSPDLWRRGNLPAVLACTRAGSGCRFSGFRPPFGAMCGSLPVAAALRTSGPGPLRVVPVLALLRLASLPRQGRYSLRTVRSCSRRRGPPAGVPAPDPRRAARGAVAVWSK